MKSFLLINKKTIYYRYELKSGKATKRGRFFKKYGQHVFTYLKKMKMF